MRRPESLLISRPFFVNLKRTTEVFFPLGNGNTLHCGRQENVLAIAFLLYRWKWWVGLHSSTLECQLIIQWEWRVEKLNWELHNTVQKFLWIWKWSGIVYDCLISRSDQRSSPHIEERRYTFLCSVQSNVIGNNVISHPEPWVDDFVGNVLDMSSDWGHVQISQGQNWIAGHLVTFPQCILVVSHVSSLPPRTKTKPVTKPNLQSSWSEVYFNSFMEEIICKFYFCNSNNSINSKIKIEISIEYLLCNHKNCIA